MKRRVGDVLTGLVREAREERSAERARHMTGLGLPLLPTDQRTLRIDVSEYRVLGRVSALASQLCDEILDQANFGIGDVMVQRRLVASETPEIVALGVSSVCFYARLAVVDALVGQWSAFRDQLTSVLVAIQSPRWGGVVFPGAFAPASDAHGSPSALLFPFHHLGEENRFFLVEHEPASRFLRITLESAAEMRLQLKRIRHRVVPAEVARTASGDLLSSAETVLVGVHRASADHRLGSAEDEAQQPSLFHHLRARGFPELATLALHWTPVTGNLVLTGERREWIDFLARVLFVLVDEAVGAALREGWTVEAVAGGFRAFLDSSQRGRCLNLSLGERRDQPRLEDFLVRMPRVKAVADRHRGLLEGIRVVLIHHITGEVLATMQALLELGAAFLDVHFVQYAAAVPRGYLDALLGVAEERCRTRALQRLDAPGSIGGRYRLSTAFSSLAELAELDAVLAQGHRDFLDAMRVSTLQMFFSAACQARRLGQHVLLVEDGGYVGPVLNRGCLEGWTVGATLDRIGLGPLFPAIERDVPLSSWLTAIMPGSVEHTRNGFDALAEVEQAHGRLHLPACSIAISDLKRGDEAWQVSQTILNAVEGVLFAEGFELSARHPLVLGCAGAIGSKLMRDLTARLSRPQICGVDIALGEVAAETAGWHRARTLGELSREHFLEVDLIIGVVGRSVLDAELLEDLVINGRAPRIFVASGSTKTVEYTDLIAWLDRLLHSPAPEIGGRRVGIEVSPVATAHSRMVVASRVHLEIQGGRGKTLYLLAGLMPVNFLHFGVPTETMDRVLEQLLRVSSGLIERWRAGEPLPPRLLAVDRDVDAEARALSAVSPPSLVPKH